MKHLLRSTLGMLLLVAVFAPAFPASAQDVPAPAAPADKPKAKPKPKPKPKPAPAAAAAPAAPTIGGVQPTLLGTYGDWGAYTASPNGKKMCFALAKPGKMETHPANRPRDPA